MVTAAPASGILEGVPLRRPLFGWVMAVVCGTALGFFFPFSLTWLCGATLFLLCAWLKTFRALASFALIACCFFLTAWHAAEVQLEHRETSARLTHAQTNRETFTIIGVVGNSRTIINRKRGGPYCRFHLDAARFADGSPIAGTRIQIYYYDRKGNFPQVGETWQLRGKLRRQSAYGTHSFSAQGRVAKHLVEADKRWHPTYLLYPVREALARNLTIGVSDEEALLTQTMVLGGHKKLPYTLRQRYADAGILHIFAISGLHIGIVTGLLVAAIATFGLSLRLRAVILLPILLLYLILTGVPPSATRACLMALLYFFGPVFLRRGNLAAAFALTAAIVLILEPAWIAHLGALLSFGVMGGILLWMHPLTTLFAKVLRVKRHRTLLANERLGLAWHVRLRLVIATYLALTLSAWLAAFPLTLVFFGRVSIVGLILNFFVPTLTIGIVWMACISSFVGFILPPLALVFNHLNAFILSMIDQLSQYLIPFPWAVIAFPESPSVLIFFVLEGLFIWGGIRLRQWEWHVLHAEDQDPFAE